MVIRNLKSLSKFVEDNYVMIGVIILYVIIPFLLVFVFDKDFSGSSCQDDYMGEYCEWNYI